MNHKQRIEDLEHTVKKMAEYVAYLEARSNKYNYEIEGQFMKTVRIVMNDILEKFL